MLRLIVKQLSFTNVTAQNCAEAGEYNWKVTLSVPTIIQMAQRQHHEQQFERQIAKL
jgi:hypothetical protein